MINSLFPSVFPTTTPAVPQNDQPTTDGTGTRAAVSLRQTTTTTQSQESERAHHHHHHHHNRLRESDGSNLYRTATHMIRDAFQSFRQDLRDSFQSLGFDGGMANKITKGVMHATRDALRSGVDFSAKLTFAAITQVGASAATEATDAAGATEATDAAGATDSTNAVATTDATSTTRAVAPAPLFSIVARSIEVNINHSTGTVDVKAASVSIEGQPGTVSGGDQPHLLDISDSDQGLSSALNNVLIALQDLAGLFGGADDSVEAPTDGTGDAAALSAAGDIVDAQAGDPAATTTLVETSTERAAVAPTLQSVTAEETTPAAGTEEAEAAPETPAEETQEATPKGPALPEIKTPLLLNDPNYTARIFITAFQQTVNDRQESFTFMRFDAIIPLSSNSTAPKEDTQPAPTDTQASVVETPVIETPVVETPVVETPVVETPVVEPTLDQTISTIV